MTGPMLLQALAVFLIGVPAAFVSRTAGALVLAYLAVQGLWMATGVALDEVVLLWIDLACVAAICTRPPVIDCYRGTDLAPLFACLLWRERTGADRFVLACFVPTWAAYVFLPDTWWPCWVLSLAQLFAASGEALHDQITRRGPSAALTEDERPPGGVLFAAAGSMRGGG